MPFNKLQFQSGIVSDITPFSNQGGYTDGDKIRFRLGSPEKIGGWEKYSSNTYLGSARRLHNWVALDGSDFMGIGTHLKYYIEEGQTFNDITPIRVQTSPGDVTFSASVSDNFDSTGDGSNDSTLITVTDNAHGANENDFVTFSGVNSVGLGSGGNITQAILQSEFQITSIINSNSYKITANVVATADDDETGGSSIVAKYQINVGLDNTIGGTGWGAGFWSGTTNAAVNTTLNGAINNSTTTVVVSNSNPVGPEGVAHQIVVNDIIVIEDELMLVTNVATNTLTVVRAYAGAGASTNVNTAAHGGSNDTLTQSDGTTITVNSVTSNVVTDAVAHSNSVAVFLAGNSTDGTAGNASADNDFVGWGSAAAVRVSGAQIRLWSHDNFGEDLLINPRDGGIFYWDKSDGVTNRAEELSATDTFSSGQTSVPQVAKQVLVSDQDRHIICFGCDGIGATPTTTRGDGIQAPLLIRFSSQENPVDFFPTDINTAGDLRIGGGSTFMQAVETKEQILVFTNKSLHSMRFTGPPFTFGIKELSKNITIMSPFSAIAVDDSVYWMGIDTFYVYNGSTQQLPCTVKDKIFLDLNLEERDKVHVGVNTEFSEIWWFYPSITGNSNTNREIDKYVIYNYIENIWYFGTLARQAWLDRGIRNLPMATGGQYLYNHETGFDDDGSAMTSFVETAPIALGNADRFSFVNSIIPDINFQGSTAINPQVDFTIKARTHSGSGFTQTDDSNTTQRSASTPVEAFTNKLDVRIRGRTFALRVEDTGASLGTKFKLGSPQVNIIQDGRR